VDDTEAKPLAGGMTLIPVLKQRMNRPSQLIDLAGLGLSKIVHETDHLVIGAMTPHWQVACSAEVGSTVAGLRELAGDIGDRQVRYRGTIGGSLANNDPSACYPAAVLALAAQIQTDQRLIAADDFFQGMFTTALSPGELITEVRFPFCTQGAYAKFSNPASRYAMAGVFVAKTSAGVRVAVTGAGQNGVFRAVVLEDALASSFTPEALDGLVVAEDEMNSDIHGSAAYRAHLVTVLAKRAVAIAIRSKTP